MLEGKKIFMCSVFAEALYKSRRELILEFIKLGYEVILAAPEKEDFLKKEFNNMKVKYYQIKLERTGLNPLKDYKTIKEIAKIISIEKPEITYAFGGAKAAIYTTIAASKEKVEKNYCMINGLGSIYRSNGTKIKVIKFLMNFLFKYSLSKANGVLFQNNDDLIKFTKLKLVREEKCIIVNGSGVNLEKYPYTSIESKDIFLFVGRLLKDKGIYEFVEAAKIVKLKYPKAQFWVVGGFDSNPTAVKEREVKMWEESGLIKYFGRRKEILSFYQKCSVFVLPSYHEGTPRTSLEAMAVGRPIISTNAPGCKETVLNEVTGFLIPIKNSSILAEKMVYFIKNQSKLQEMGEESFMLAKEKYEISKVNASIIKFLLS